jgi:hypothetical protein
LSSQFEFLFSKTFPKFPQTRNESKEPHCPQTVLVIPLASKLLARLTANFRALSKSKRFLRLLKKKLDAELKYDVNDLHIITGLTERLLTIQTLLTAEANRPTEFDLAEMDMVPQPMDTAHAHGNPKLGTALMSSSFSFGSPLSDSRVMNEIEKNSFFFFLKIGGNVKLLSIWCAFFSIRVLNI